MAKEHDEIRALKVSKGWQIVDKALDIRQKAIENAMYDIKRLSIKDETLDEHIKRRLREDDLLRVQLHYIQLVRQLPDKILATELKNEDEMKEILEEFEQKFL